MMSRNWNAPSNSPGRNGRFSSIPTNARSLSATTPGRLASQVPRAQVRPSSPCIGPSTWHRVTPTHGSCSRPFRTPLPMRFGRGCKRLISNEPRLAERLDVHSFPAIGLRLYKSHLGAESRDSGSYPRPSEGGCRDVGGHKFSPHSWWPSGNRSWTRGSWTVGRRTATLYGWAKNPAPGGAAGAPLVHLRACSQLLRKPCADHGGGNVQQARRCSRRARSSFRLCRGR